MQRDTLPKGGMHVRYTELPDLPPAIVEPDLVIGELDGDANEVFSDVRAVEADEDGAVYVLDHQTSEVRVFDSEGHHLRNLTRQGEGPGELVAANGMVFSHDILWIHDHGQWQMVGLASDGEEVGRAPIHVQDFGWFWGGGLDDEGRFWKRTSWPIGPRSSGAPVGLQERRSRVYMSFYDPATGIADSISLGTHEWRSFATDEGGYRFFPIPFEPRELTAFDPAGGFWLASGQEYQLVRLDQEGDTLLILDIDFDPRPVTRQDKDRFMAAFLKEEPDGGSIAESLVQHAGDRHPAIDQIFLDDERRLWVRRYAVDSMPRYDVFTREGDHVALVDLTFRPPDYLPPRVRHGSLYAVVSDEFGVQRVVRGSVGIARGAGEGENHLNY